MRYIHVLIDKIISLDLFLGKFDNRTKAYFGEI